MGGRGWEVEWQGTGGYEHLHAGGQREEGGVEHARARQQRDRHDLRNNWQRSQSLRQQDVSSTEEWRQV